MASLSSTAFLAEHKDFVLKIKIREQNTESNDGEVQIRRVPLPRIADSNGFVSYEELVGLVLTFTFSAEPSPDAKNNYQISLTYFDVDNDPITIGSTNELIDAIDQFAGMKVLRITAEVKPRIGFSSQKPESSSKPAATSTSTLRQDGGTSTTELPSFQPQINNVLDAFVGVLATAVTHLQEGVKDLKSPPKPTTARNTQPSQGGAAEKSSDTASNVENPAKKAEEAKSAPVESPSEVENEQNASNESSAKESAPAPEEQKKEESKEEAPKQQRPFIHGRHTCDSCLTTPIVGKRYHAKNLPDYDLCERCFKNYKGADVEFESVELDRDRAFQERWHRRRSKIEKFESQRANANVGCRGQRGRRFVPHMPPSAPTADPTEPPASSEFDNALKEAIRRSLADVGPKEAVTVDAEKAASVASKEEEVVVTSSGKKEEDEIVVPPSDHDTSVAAAEEIVPDEPSAEEAVPVFTAEAESSTHMKGDIEEAFEESEDKDSAFEDAMEVGSVDSEKLAADEESDKKPPAVERETSQSLKDDSFASDAVGSGDVAEAMGATLDMVVGVISEMLSEADAHYKTSPTNSKKDESSEAHDDLIVPSVQDSCASSMPADTEDNDWQVVKESGSEDDFAQEDNEIGRAAEMLGSALFNSDMRSSEDHVSENLSTLSDSFSVPSVVHSISAGSHVAEAQRSCWASQLSKLRELGFDDESLCVEILERLKAANIGVESDDEISVTAVVNALLERS
jgi:hypothetical protein